MLDHGERMSFRPSHRIYPWKRSCNLISHSFIETKDSLVSIGSKQLIRKSLLIIFKRVEHMLTCLSIIVKSFSWLASERVSGERIRLSDVLLLSKIDFIHVYSSAIKYCEQFTRKTHGLILVE